MVEVSLLGAFIVTAFAFALSPGPSNLFAVSVGLRHGFRSAFVNILGDQSAAILYMMLAALGVGTLLLVFPPILIALKLIGAAYLIGSGLKTILATRARHKAARTDHPVTEPRAPPTPSDQRLYLRGIGVSLTNPKAILFFGALFPLFIVPNQPVVPQLLLLGALELLIDTGVMVGYVLLALLTKRAMSNPHLKRWTDRATGSILVAAGLALGAGDSAAARPIAT